MLLVDTEGHTQLANVFLREEPLFACLQFRERYYACQFKYDVRWEEQ